MTSFTQRLTLRFAVLVTVMTAGVLTFGGWLLDRQMDRSVELLHEVEFRELTELIGNDPTLSADDLRERIVRGADSDLALYFVQIHSSRGAVLFRTPNLGENVLPDLTGQTWHLTTDLPGIGAVHVSEFHDGPWHFQIGSPLAPQRRLLHDYLEIAALLMLGVACAGVGLGYWFSRYTLDPVRTIEQTAHRISAQTLSARIPVPPGQDELTALAVLLNQMFDRLEASFAQVQRFTADASHELKTPLALVRLNAEKLRSRLNNDPEAQSTVEDLLEEVARLQQIIESLLFLSRADSGGLPLKAREFEVSAFLRDFADDAVVLAEDRRITFVLEEVSDGVILAERNLLRQLLLNLLTNALAVTPQGGVVSLAARATEGKWTFVVSDTGPGLPVEQLNRIFERFVRYEIPGQEPRSGHGLGLAICQTIAQMHRGTIRAANRTDRAGLSVSVEIPFEPAATLEANRVKSVESVRS